MKVFLSWSGARSNAMATALKEWLPDVLQGTEVWMSQHDIDAGTRWAPDLSAILEATQFGIICLTPENQKEPWLLYEAGAISKSVVASRLVPYLLGEMTPSDVVLPLAQFQAVQADRAGTLKLLESIDAISESRLGLERVRRVVEKWWPDLESRIQDAVAKEHKSKAPPPREADDMLREILLSVRAMERQQGAQALQPHAVVATNNIIKVRLGTLVGRKFSGPILILRDTIPLGEFIDKVSRALTKHFQIEDGAYGRLWALKSNRTGAMLPQIGGSVVEASTMRDIDVVAGDTLHVLPLPCEPRPAVGPDGPQPG